MFRLQFQFIKYFFLFFFISAIIKKQNGYKVIDKIVAKINGDPIFKSDLEQGKMHYLEQFKGKDIDIEFEVFKNIVISKLFLTKASQDIDIDANIINAYTKDRIKQLVLHYGSVGRLERASRMKINEINKVIRKNIAEGFKVDSLKRNITKNVSVGVGEVKEYLRKNFSTILKNHNKQVCLKRIVKHLKITKKEYKETKDLLNEIQKKLLQGEDFGELAKKYSDDLISRIEGGDIGYFFRYNKSLFSKKYEQAAIKLKPVELSKPPYQTSEIVETPIGMYLIQLLQRRGNTYRTRHILIKPKDLKGQRQQAIKELNKIKDRILNKRGDEFISQLFVAEREKIEKEKDNYKFSGYLQNANGIRFEKGLHKLPKGIPNNIYSMKKSTIIGPSLTSTKVGPAMQIVLVESVLDARKVNLKYDFEEIKSVVLKQKKHDVVKKWILKAKSKSDIYIDEDYKKYENKLWD